MTPAEAAATYLEYQPIVDVVSSKLETAKKVLKAHLEGRTSYKGITTSAGGSNRLDMTLVREALGPKKIEACTVFTPSLGLVLPAHLRKGAVELTYELTPVTP